MDGMYARNAGAIAGDAMDGMHACDAGAASVNCHGIAGACSAEAGTDVAVQHDRL